jgi:hypothetical protein
MGYRSRKQDRDQKLERRIDDSWTPSIHRYISAFDSTNFPARKVRVCQVCIKKNNDFYLAKSCTQIL